MSNRRNEARPGGFLCDVSIICAGVPVADVGQRKPQHT